MRRGSVRGLNFGRRRKKINVPLLKEIGTWVIEIAIVLVISFVFVYFIGLRTTVVGQSMMAAAMNAPVTVMDTASEGGAWGMAVLAAFMEEKEENETLTSYLAEKIFAGQTGTTIAPNPEDVAGFDAFIKKYVSCLPAERGAVEGL